MAKFKMEFLIDSDDDYKVVEDIKDIKSDLIYYLTVMPEYPMIINEDSIQIEFIEE